MRPHSPLRRSIRALLAAALALAPAASRAEGYTLGPQDRIRVKVVEWRGSVGQFFEWTPLGGEYTIGGSGQVSLPLVGEIRATGLRTDELSAQIALRLRDRVGLVDLPAASVEVSQFRPFYILGGVERPGEYPFRPGLTVVQALGIAGGHYRPTEAGLVRMQRDAIAANGDYRVRDLELRKQTAREARLLAELDESAKISFPAEFAADSGNRTLIRDEEMAFKARSEALGAQVEGAQRLVELFRNEITALAAKTKAQDRQLELINKEKDSITSLVQKGLAVAPRQYLLERTAAEIESKRLDLDTSALRARQEMVKAERSIIDFRNDRRREVLDLLQDARARKADAAQRAETAQILVQEAEVIAPRLLADRQRMLSARPVYRLIRQDADGTHESIVAETAALRPGDIVKVETGDPDERLATALGPTGTTR